MRKRWYAIILGVALAVSVTMLASPTRATATPVPGHNGLVTLCFAAKHRPDVEHTVRVPRFLAQTLIDATASYRGPCAAYGESAARGQGRLTAYTQQQHGKPYSIGVSLSSGTLNGLPHDPPTDGTTCYDKDGDGATDPMTECANGYGNILKLNTRRHIDTPFRYLMVDWNPHGHGPPDVYDLPHFDVHFYLQPDAERRAIRPGPCEELVNCDDYVLGKKLPAAKYRPADYEDLNALSPRMGNHLIDRTGPEFHGKRFTHTFIYGTWNRHVTFLEPMVTREYLQGVATGTRADTCVPIKTPRAVEKSGWYPTKYCMRHRDNRDELTISVEGFVHRVAG